MITVAPLFNLEGHMDIDSTVPLAEVLYPPPWNMYEHPEKTEGWFAFQLAMKKEPEYYPFRRENALCGDDN